MIEKVNPSLAVAFKCDREKEESFLLDALKKYKVDIYPLHQSRGIEAHFRKKEDVDKYLSYLSKYKIT